MLALAGVVINDSLVLVDFVNKRRLEGLNISNSVRVAGVARFRAILLTSLTTFFGAVSYSNGCITRVWHHVRHPDYTVADTVQLSDT